MIAVSGPACAHLNYSNYSTRHQGNISETIIMEEVTIHMEHTVLTLSIGEEEEYFRTNITA